MKIQDTLIAHPFEIIFKLRDIVHCYDVTKNIIIVRVPVEIQETSLNIAVSITCTEMGFTNGSSNMWVMESFIEEGRTSDFQKKAISMIREIMNSKWNDVSTDHT